MMLISSAFWWAT